MYYGLNLNTCAHRVFSSIVTNAHSNTVLNGFSVIDSKLIETKIFINTTTYFNHYVLIV